MEKRDKYDLLYEFPAIIQNWVEVGQRIRGSYSNQKILKIEFEKSWNDWKSRGSENNWFRIDIKELIDKNEELIHVYKYISTKFYIKNIQNTTVTFVTCVKKRYAIGK